MVPVVVAFVVGGGGIFVAPPNELVAQSHSNNLGTSSYVGMGFL